MACLANTITLMIQFPGVFFSPPLLYLIYSHDRPCKVAASFFTDFLMSLFIASYCLFFGGFAGFMVGLVGIGGGFILVPALSYLFYSEPSLSSLMQGQEIYFAIGTSLASGGIMSFVAKFKNQKLGTIDYSLAGQFIFPIIVGSMVGAIVAVLIHIASLKIFFGLYCLYAAWNILRSKSIQVEDHDLDPQHHLKKVGFFGFIVGGLGVGIANILIPFFIRHGVDLRKAVATASYIQAPLALAGVFMYIALGLMNHAHGPALSLGYVDFGALIFLAISSALGAHVGASLSHQVSIPLLKRIFAALTAVIGLSIIVQSLWPSSANFKPSAPSVCRPSDPPAPELAGQTLAPALLSPPPPAPALHRSGSPRARPRSGSSISH